MRHPEGADPAAAAPENPGGGCPSEQELFGLVYELPEEDRAAELRAHVAACPPCLETMAELGEVAEDLVAACRGPEVGVRPPGRSFVSPQARARLAGGRAPSARVLAEDRRGSMAGLLGSLSSAVEASREETAAATGPDESHPDRGAVSGSAPKGRTSKGQATPGIAGERGARERPILRRAVLLGGLALLALTAVGLLARGLWLHGRAQAHAFEPFVFVEVEAPAVVRGGDVFPIELAMTPVVAPRGEASATTLPSCSVAATLRVGDVLLDSVTTEVSGQGRLELTPPLATPAGGLTPGERVALHITGSCPVEGSDQVVTFDSTRDLPSAQDLMEVTPAPFAPSAVLIPSQAIVQAGETLHVRGYVFAHDALDAVPGGGGARAGLGRADVELRLVDAAGTTVDRVIRMRGTERGSVWSGDLVWQPGERGRYEVQAWWRAPTVRWREEDQGIVLTRNEREPWILLAREPLLVQRSVAVTTSAGARVPGGGEDVANETPARRLQVTMTPESGELVVDRPSRIYVEVRDTQGTPVSAELQLFEKGDAQATLAATATDVRGRARLEVTPQIGKRYLLRVQPHAEQLAETIRPLPSAYVQGATLRATRDVYRAGEPLTFEVMGLDDGTGSAAGSLTLRSRGQLVGETVFGPPEAGVEVRRVQVAALETAGGALRATLHDARGVAVAERLVYLAPGQELRVDVEPLEASVGTGAETRVRVRTLDAQGRPVSGRAFVVVSELASLGQPSIPAEELGARLRGDLLLAGAVRQLEDTGLVAAASTDPEAARSLDLLLGVQGWRRLDACSSPDPASPRPDQLREACTAVAAQEEAAPGSVHLSNESRVADERGRFSLERRRLGDASRTYLRMGSLLALLAVLAPVLLLLVLAVRAMEHRQAGGGRSALALGLLLLLPIVLALSPLLLGGLRNLAPKESVVLPEAPVAELPRLAPLAAERVAVKGRRRQVAHALPVPPARLPVARPSSGHLSGERLPAMRRTGEGGRQADALPSRVAHGLGSYLHVADPTRVARDLSAVLAIHEVETDANGEAILTFATADVEGAILARALAWTDRGDGGVLRMGSGAASFQVERRLRIDHVDLPRDLSVGDRAHGSIRLRWQDSPSGELRSVPELTVAVGGFGGSAADGGATLDIVERRPLPREGEWRGEEVRLVLSTGDGGVSSPGEAGSAIEAPLSFRVRSGSDVDVEDARVTLHDSRVEVRAVVIQSKPRRASAQGSRGTETFQLPLELAPPGGVVENGTATVVAFPNRLGEVAYLMDRMIQELEARTGDRGATTWAAEDPTRGDLEAAVTAALLVHETLAVLDQISTQAAGLPKGWRERTFDVRAKRLAELAEERLAAHLVTVDPKATDPRAVAPPTRTMAWEPGGAPDLDATALALAGWSALGSSKTGAPLLESRSRAIEQELYGWVVSRVFTTDGIFHLADDPDPLEPERDRAVRILWALAYARSSDNSSPRERRRIQGALQQHARFGVERESDPDTEADALWLAYLLAASIAQDMPRLSSQLTRRLADLQVTRKGLLRGSVGIGSERLETTALMAALFHKTGLSPTEAELADDFLLRERGSLLLRPRLPLVSYVVMRLEQFAGNTQARWGWGSSPGRILRAWARVQAEDDLTGSFRPRRVQLEWVDSLYFRAKGLELPSGAALVKVDLDLDGVVNPNWWGGVSEPWTVLVEARGATPAAAISGLGRSPEQARTQSLFPSVHLDRNALRVGEEVPLRVGLRATLPHTGVVVRIPLPAGLEVASDSLESLVAAGRCDQASVRGRELVLTWRRLAARDAVALQVPLVARRAGSYGGLPIAVGARLAETLWLPPLEAEIGE